MLCCEHRQVVGIDRRRGRDAGIAECRAAAIVVPVHLHRLVGGRRRIGRRPALGKVEALPYGRPRGGARIIAGISSRSSAVEVRGYAQLRIDVGRNVQASRAVIQDWLADHRVEAVRLQRRLREVHRGVVLHIRTMCRPGAPGRYLVFSKDLSIQRPMIVFIRYAAPP
jgi:hypothetical protein